ncbi:threonine aldolase family protein [Marinomonas ostreistagni]|uniref:Aminotransferase class I/II-fold pyridoxal phosphate-dependent enzyme n=1 Tax=Marinomonas ostreistagni TaxID=359209 RepID=A0ABS0ZFE0_9GAMM|nr:aminotransferase class I/II-fold pyridoxal phosphate-dependent enzyme [Marinomonas ostreistagni]MBJ7552394.1 aminotransferase class I/II-fold pyridoxal phosphate-dependent enzyme [Marinomonas ostreistagni]
MRYSFLNDYSEGAHPSILNALVESNMVQQTPYGGDVFSVDAKQRIRNHLGESFSGSVHFVASGTLANLVSISSVLKPYEAVITVQSGHIVSHEAGAIEATGHKLITVPGVEGKLTPENLREAIAKNSFFPHMAKPGLIYISNVTEMGTVYTHAELSALSAIAKEHGLLLFMDGARMGMALASNKNDMTLADIAELCDVFWIGGTKVGALLGEAIVVSNPELVEGFDICIKQKGGLLAKGRVLGVQFQTLFNDELLYVEIARHANAMAAQLAEGIKAAGYDLQDEPDANQVFAILPNTLIETLKQSFEFFVWQPVDDAKSLVRLVTSWATEESQVIRFVGQLKG